MSKPRRRNVNVILQNAGPPVAFALASSLMKAGRLTFINDHKPGFEIYFKLVDQGNTGLRFPDDPNLALAAQPGAGCPAQGQVWNQFNPVYVSDDNLTLKVHNLNKVPTQFWFTLFVTLTPHAQNPVCLPLDPGGDNQNGNTD